MVLTAMLVLGVTASGAEGAAKEITFSDVPESLPIGQDLYIPVDFPDENTYISYFLFMDQAPVDSSGIYISPASSGMQAAISISGDQLLRTGLKAGSEIVIKCRCQDLSGKTFRASTPSIRITGTDPVLTTFDKPEGVIAAGGTLRLSGNAGDAASVQVSLSGTTPEQTSVSDEANINENGKWFIDIPNIAAGQYSVNIQGRRDNNRSTGSIDDSVYVKGTLPAPSVTVPDNIQAYQIYEITASQNAAAEDQNPQWFIYGEKRNSNEVFSSWYYYGKTMSYSDWNDYQENITLRVAYRIGEDWSEAAVVNYVVNGSERPVKGKIPIQLTVPDEGLAGVDLPVLWTPVDSTQNIYFNLYDAKGNFCFSASKSGAGLEGGISIIIPGSALIPGEYQLSCSSSGKDYEDTSFTFEFTISENPARPGAPAITETDPAILTDMTSSAPAFLLDRTYDSVSLDLFKCEDYGNGPEWYKYSYENIVADNTDRIAYTRRLNGLGEYRAEISVKVNGVWSEKAVYAFSVVEAPELKACTVTLNKDPLPVGESLTLTISDIDEPTESINVRVGNFQKIYPCTGENLIVQVGEEYLEPGNDNYILVSLGADGYQYYRFSKNLTVTGSRPAAPEVSFDSTSGIPGDLVHVTINVPGATLVEYRNTWNEGTVISLQDGRGSIPIPIDYYNMSADYLCSYQFRTKVNGVWSKWTDFTRLYSVDRPEYGDTDFVVLPDQIIPGEDLEFTFLPVEGITNYYICVGTYSMNTDKPGKVYVPSVVFSEGGDFYFDIGAGNEYAGDLLIAPSFHLQTEPFEDRLPEPLQISADRTEGTVGDPIEISFGGKQATRYLLQRRWGEYDSWQIFDLYSGPAAGFVRNLEPGSYQFRISAEINGKWTAWSNALEFTGTMVDIGDLTNPVVNVSSDTIYEGQSLHVSWDKVEGADTYRLQWINLTTSRYEFVNTINLSYDIEAEKLPRGEYLIYVHSLYKTLVPGAGPIKKTFRVVRNPQTPITGILTLPSGILEVHADAVSHSGAERIILPASCRTVGSRAFSCNTHLVDVIVNGMDTKIAADAFLGCGEFTLKVRHGSVAEADFRNRNGITIEYLD